MHIVYTVLCTPSPTFAAVVSLPYEVAQVPDLAVLQFYSHVNVPSKLGRYIL
jgi:hypothetical protein